MLQRALQAITVVVVLLAALPSGGQQGVRDAGDEVRYRHPRPEISGWTPAADYGDQLRRGLVPPRSFTVVREPSHVGHIFRDDAIDISVAVRTPHDGCWYPQPFSFEPSGFDEEPVETLESLVAASPAIALGVVTGIEGGAISLGGPGLMPQVEVTRWLKRAPGQQQGDIVHVFYPRGTFHIDGVRICATAAYDFPPPPREGARILLFPAELGRDPATFPMGDLASRMAFETEIGARATPELRRVPEFRAISFRDMLRLTREALRAAEEDAR